MHINLIEYMINWLINQLHQFIKDFQSFRRWR